jgi:hypothetical protein
VIPLGTHSTTNRRPLRPPRPRARKWRSIASVISSR